MSRKRLETLRKEINGKQLKYREPFRSALKMDVLLICPPGGKSVVVKPYGHTPKEVRDMINEHVHAGFSLEKVSAPSFCIAKHDVCEATRATLEYIAKIPQGGTYNFKTATGMTSGCGEPSCPYTP